MLGNSPTPTRNVLEYVGRYTASNAVLSIPNIDLTKWDYLIAFEGKINETTDIILGWRDLSTWVTFIRGENNTLSYGGAYIVWANTYFSSLVHITQQGNYTCLTELSGNGAAKATYTGTPKTEFVVHKYRSSLGALIEGSAVVWRYKKGGGGLVPYLIFFLFYLSLRGGKEYVKI